MRIDCAENQNLTVKRLASKHIHYTVKGQRIISCEAERESNRKSNDKFLSNINSCLCMNFSLEPAFHQIRSKVTIATSEFTV